MKGFLRIPLIKIGFAAIEKWLIGRINFLPLRKLLEGNLQLIKDVTDKLTDTNPDNTAQLKELWEEYKEGTTSSIVENTILSIRELVKDKDESDFIISTFVELLTNVEDKQAAKNYLNAEAQQAIFAAAKAKIANWKLNQYLNHFSAGSSLLWLLLYFVVLYHS